MSGFPASTTRVHSLQTGTVSVKPGQFRASGPHSLRRLRLALQRRWAEPMPVRAWLIEHPEGLIVVDTGERADLPITGPGRLFVQKFIEPHEEIGVQVQALGFSVSDVRRVVLTHLHDDHVNGLHAFEQAEVFVSRTEYELATGPKGALSGYQPRHWPAWFKPHLVDFTEGPLPAFPQSFPLTRAGDVLLVPTPGHTPGHLSVIVRQADLSVFLAGDASYTEQLLLDQVIDGTAFDDAVDLQTRQRILRFIRETPTVYLPTHDPQAETRLRSRFITSA